MPLLYVRCPACDRRLRVPESCLGEPVHCPCKRRFVIPKGWRHRPAPATPSAVSVPAPIGKDDLEAAMAPLHAGINNLLDAATAPTQLPPELQALCNRVLIDTLFEETVASLQAEKDRHEQRARELESRLEETTTRFRKLENDLQRAENVNTRRTDEHQRFLECLLPNLVFLDGSIPFMFEELEDYRHVLRVLHQLQTAPNQIGFRDFQSAAGWLEVDKHISSGRSNDVRVYVRKVSNGTTKYRVLVSKKGCQDRDKKRMQDAT